KYSTHKGPLPSTKHIGYLLRIPPDWDYLRRLRDLWKGDFVIKGILTPEDAVQCQKDGADAVWISNHAARQFEAAPAAIDCVAPIRAAVGPDYPLIYDSGVENALDILRAIALGADFVMLGKAFHYGVGALGEKGAEQVVHILKEDLQANMVQMCIARPAEAHERLYHG
ncbi:MAG: alpha-hydroxy-acid oxidizing protein, partial [Paracoccaceae bacterium]|nr:alpha-hydroxy-acid oxidizing protein [Paracoccaceae bacterium]